MFIDILDILDIIVYIVISAFGGQSKIQMRYNHRAMSLSVEHTADLTLLRLYVKVCVVPVSHIALSASAQVHR